MRSPFAAAAASLLLAGCAVFKGPDMPQHSPEARWLERKAVLEQVDRFSLQARVAGSGSLGMKAELRWQQNADGSFDLRLAGPFGAGAVSIAGSPGHVEVRSREGRQFTTDPELWIRQRFGWSLPIGGLRYWALGLPSPQSPASIELDPEGKIAVLEQDGWRLEYDEYQPAGPLSLPRRLQLANAEVTIKLIADRWDGLPFATDSAASPPAEAFQP
ncbi:MAG TPA: lipoprotein insertase outer membrane protein LolB [Solimonas sp.]|nr:lipoprotein insertase outer membrane protein LolB [Solimonas sp.]